MHIATSYTYHSGTSTTLIVLIVAPLIALGLGANFFFAYRRNQRMAAQQFGGLTPTEAKLNRGHGLAIMLVLFGSMALAVGAVLLAPVRNALADIGENSRWLTFAAIPLVLLYGRWLSRRVRTAALERAQRGR